MLPGTASALPPSRSIDSTASSHACALRLEITTEAPHDASAPAIARPIPREPPVMIATRPSRSNAALSSAAVVIASCPW